MKNVFLVFKTDVWHTAKSKDLLSVCESFDKAMSIIETYIKDKNEALSENDITNLKNINQTQGFEGECTGEFVIDEEGLNCFII